MVLTTFSDDIDFPPLAPVPVPREREAVNTLRSHAHSVRSSQDSTARSSTPKIPPGLSLPHAHPPPAHGRDLSTPQTQQQRPASAAPGQVAPAVPIFHSAPRASTPKAKLKYEPTVELKVVKQEASNAKSDDSKLDESPITASQKAENSNSESRVPRKEQTGADFTNADALEHTTVRRDETNATTNNPTTTVDAVPSTEVSAGSVPEKLDDTVAREAKLPSALQSPAIDQTPILASSAVATPPVLSRPGTPATAASRTSESSGVRPKTIRITSTISQKTDTAPASAVTEKSMTLPSVTGKQLSRQPSISSISRSCPSTPAISEHPYSNDVSRASSPPPSTVGSRPEKSKSKNQIRKEKKLKAREGTDTNSEGPSAPAERKVEERGPIIARHMKKKKTQERSPIEAESSATVAAENVESKIPTVPESSRVAKQQSNKNAKAAGNGEQASTPADDVAVEAEAELEKKLPVPAARKEDKVTSSGTPKEPYTLNQLLNDSGKASEPEAFKTLLDEHISNIQTLLSQLFESKQLDQSSALFNLPPLSSYRLPPDPRRGIDYLEGNGYTMSSPFGQVYLNSKQKKELQQGSAVRISDPNRPNELLRRTLITKNGRVYHHLSQEEEDRVLALDRRREEDEQMYGELARKDMSKLDEADLMNIEGGLEHLLQPGNKHGISVVRDESKNDDGDMDEDGDMGDVEPVELASLAAGWQAVNALGMVAAPAATGKEHGVDGQQAPKKSVNLRGMDMAQLQRTIRETQTEMEQARKEMEAMEKKWAKKGKEATKWREMILKGKVAVGSD